MGARGFTFIELMLTLAIMAVLLLVAAPMAQLTLQRQRESELRLALQQIREALDTYKRASDQGRIAAHVGESGYPRSLNDLVQGMPDERSPIRQRIYFLRRLPIDPFHTDLTATPADTWGLRSYNSPPDNPREGDDVFDVYSKSARVGLNGVPYKIW